MHAHNFDPISGWCSRCGLRDDGRLINKGGDELRPPREQDLDELEHA
jgi:hypothetical protein